jgi:hypothetical protein
MYCRIRNRECPSAGEITVKGCKAWGEKEGEYKYTICYRVGGRLACV